jgi:erythromycin esterase
MKNIIFLFIINIITLNTFICQTKKESVEINSIEPNSSNDNDLKSLDSIIGNRKIIGMGESTHGTSEFTTMRHRFFKYLVENHGYNSFFLEADFAACQRVNRYIHGEMDSIKNALNEVKLWPWRTEEMLTFIEWMRSYNLSHENKIMFIGCDMQLIEDDFLEIERFLKKVTTKDSFQFTILKSSPYPFDKKNILQEKTRWIEFISKFNERDLSTIDLNTYSMLKQGINQWFDFNLLENRSFNFRDSCMSVNIISYLDLNPNSKGFYFAHNFHVSKAIHTYKKGKNYDKKTTGRYLFEKYNYSYFSILQDFNEGNFNAFNFKDGKFNFEVFTLKPSKFNTISHYFNKFNVPILFSTQIPHNKNINITQIGAVYGKDEYSRKINRYMNISKEYFDAFLFIRDTHHSNLISYKD